MANITVVTDVFCRASFPHLDAPFAHDPKDAEKYRLQLMFAKDNTYDHPEIGVIESHPYEILDALNEVCQAEFNFSVNDIEDVPFLKDEVGVQFPPSFKDGDRIMLKENSRPVPGQLDPKTAGYWLLNVTSNDQPGCIGPDENEIDPKTIYSGCWVRVQVEVSAYYNKQNNAPIVNIDLQNVQYCYDDESLGGRPQRQDAKTAFGGKKVGNSNVKSGTGTRMGRPDAGGDNGRPSRPSRPGAGKPESTRILVATGDNTLEELRDEYQMTDEEIVNEGFGEWQEQASRPSRPGADSKPSRPSRPGADSKPSRPSRPGADSKPSRPSRPGADSKPSRPGADSKPSRPAGPVLVMLEDAEYTYDELKAENWTDEDIVNSGYGEFDYTDPDA